MLKSSVPCSGTSDKVIDIYMNVNPFVTALYVSGIIGYQSVTF